MKSIKLFSMLSIIALLAACGGNSSRYIHSKSGDTIIIPPDQPKPPLEEPPLDEPPLEEPPLTPPTITEGGLIKEDGLDNKIDSSKVTTVTDAFLQDIRKGNIDLVQTFANGNDIRIILKKEDFDKLTSQEYVTTATEEKINLPTGQLDFSYNATVSGNQFDNGHYGIIYNTGKNSNDPDDRYTFANIANETDLEKIVATGNIIYSGNILATKSDKNISGSLSEKDITTNGVFELTMNFHDAKFNATLSGNDAVKDLGFRGNLIDNSLIGNVTLNDKILKDSIMEAKFAGEKAEEIFGHYNANDDQFNYLGSFGGKQSK